MINMIQLGEETGRLEEVLNSLSKYYDREDEIAQALKVPLPILSCFLP